MSDVIFCATDFYLQGGYRSYVDFFHLVKLAGYPIIPVSQIDPDSDNTFIFTPANGETVNGWPNARANIILWQLEWMLTDEHNTPPGVTCVWASDAGFAKANGFEYVPMGSDDRLNVVDANVYSGKSFEKPYDVSLLSYQTGRRQVITQQLQQHGVGLAPVSGLWEWPRSIALLQSHAMVHVHQHDHIQTVAPLRWALAAAHRLPMITETIADRGIFGYGCMVQADYEFLAAFTANMLKDKRLLADYASALHGLLCEEYTFKKVIEAHV